MYIYSDHLGNWLLASELESVARDEVTNSLWIFFGGFASLKGSSMFVVMLTIQFKNRFL